MNKKSLALLAFFSIFAFLPSAFAIDFQALLDGSQKIQRIPSAISPSVNSVDRSNDLRNEKKKERRLKRRQQDARRPNLRIGEVVRNTQRKYVKARIIDIEQDGNYVIRFLEGELQGKVGGNWDRDSLAVTEGCGVELCVGDRAYNADRSGVLVRVVAIEYNGRYVIKFLEGKLRGRFGGNWSDDELARQGGCSPDNYCVGDYVYNTKRKSVLAEIVAIESDNNFIIEFLEGELVGRRGGNWSADDLAKTYGCGERFCVGDFALNKDRNYVRVEIVGIENDGDYVIRFKEGQLIGKTGSNWSDENLARDG